MKTLSVKQVAECLGVSPRAVIKRLNNDQLKGTRRPNKYGVEEWWVYPNKEIRAALESAGKSDILVDDATDAEIVDVHTENFSPDQEELDNNAERQASTAILESVRGSAIAEELWNNIIGKFVGQLQERDMLIGEMRSEIAEKDRQLKLLPDLQKQAESERLATEIKALEVEALKKQISAMDKKQAEALEEDRRALEENAQAWKQQISALKAKQATAIEQERKLAEEAKYKAELTSKQAKELALEIAQFKAQKEAEEKAVQDQLAVLTKELEALKQPWWKKWFAPGD